MEIFMPIKTADELKLMERKLEAVEKLLSHPYIHEDDKGSDLYKVVEKIIRSDETYRGHFVGDEIDLLKQVFKEANIKLIYNKFSSESYVETVKKNLLEYKTTNQILVDNYKEEKLVKATESLLKAHSNLVNKELGKPEKDNKETKSEPTLSFNEYTDKSKAELLGKFLQEGNFKDDKNIQIKDGKRTGQTAQEKFDLAVKDLSDGTYKTYTSEQVELLKGIIREADFNTNFTRSEDGKTDLQEARMYNLVLNNPKSKSGFEKK
jgi:hypothetical protein